MEYYQWMMQISANFYPDQHNPWNISPYSPFSNIYPAINPIMNLHMAPNIEIRCQKNSQNSQKPEPNNKTQKKETYIKFPKKIIKKKRDEEFKQRQQTANRNLASNTLKIYLKQVRDARSETSKHLQSIIELNHFDYTPSKFYQQLQQHFPKDKNYIAFSKVKPLYYGNDRVSSNFSKIFRISINRFFRYEVFCLDIKPVRTTRRVRNQQIRQGRQFLNSLRS